MLVSKIISLAEAQCDESYDIDDWVDLYNLCQDELTPVAKILDTKSSPAVTVTAGKASITIATDTTALALAHRILNVYYTPAGGTEVPLRRLHPQDDYAKGYKLDATKLYLQGLGTEATGVVRTDFYKKLAHCVYVASPESYTPTTPEIPDEFHGLYVSYLCGKSQQREEEPQDEQDFMSEYEKAKQSFALERLVQMEPWNIKNIPQSGGGG